jgi:hypothetical protein
MNDVAQWLAEIKSLQQQLAEAHKEREDAYASAANWRKLYETEAQQRRIEANLSRQTIELLKAEVQQLKGIPLARSSNPEIGSEVQQAVEQLSTVADLKAKLTEVMIERDRLMQALKVEQAEHAQTRKSLTTALGDAVDMLAKEGGGRDEG